MLDDFVLLNNLVVLLNNPVLLNGFMFVMFNIDK